MSKWRKNHGATILLSEPPCPSCSPGFEGWGKGRQIPLNVTWPLINEDSGEAPLTCLPRFQDSVCFDCIFIAGCAQPVRRQWAALLSCDFWPRPVCEGPGLCLSGRSAASPSGRMHNSPSNQTPTHSFQRSYTTRDETNPPHSHNEKLVHYCLQEVNAFFKGELSPEIISSQSSH